MTEARRRQYLEALGIPVWVMRGSPAPGAAAPEPASAIPATAAESPCRLHIGPGDGAVLLVCATAAHGASVLASDLARALAVAPVLAWPTQTAGAPAIPAAVAERLLTAAVVCGPGLARSVFGGAAPETLGAACVLVLPALEEMESDPAARRSAWQSLVAAGLGAGA